MAEVDYSDDMVDQFVKDTCVELPSDIAILCEGQQEAIERRADWILNNKKIEWINFYSNRTERLWRKIITALHNEGKKVVFNTAWTRDPFKGGRFMILPRPKHIEYFDRKFYLRSKMEVRVRDDYGKKALNIINALLDEINITFSQGVNNDIEFVLSNAVFKKKEEYSIEFHNGKVVLTYGDRLGARNAVISLYGLIEKDDTGFFIQNCKIVDFPVGEYRGILLDLCRSYVPLEKIKTIILQMAIAKYNTLHLHFLDEVNNPIKTDVYPQLNEPTMQQYTKNQLKEIVEYAAFFEIEVIPELEMPAHGSFIIDRLEDLKCKTKNVEPSRWVMCVGSEKTYEIMENLIKEITEIFPGEYIHIGTDELEFYDLVEEKYWPTWDDCEVCAELCRRENIESKRELFYYFVRRIYSIISNLGKKIMMWNDQIDISISPNLPRDIRIQFWRVAAKARGPIEGCSMQRFLEEGFSVVNSYFPETYIDLYMEEEKLLKWNPKAIPDSTDDMKHFIIGGEMCAWGGVEHYERTLPSAVFVFGDKLWDYSDIKLTGDYRQALTKAVLGLKTPIGFDVFEALGCSILPLDKEKMGIPENVNIDKLKLEENVEILNSMIENGASGSTAAGVYIKCIKWIISEKYK